MLRDHEIGTFSDLLFYLESKGIDKDSARDVVMTAFNWGVAAAVDRMRPTRPKPPEDVPPIAPAQLTMLDGGVKEAKPKKAAAEPRQILCTWPESFAMGEAQVHFAQERGFVSHEIARMWERFRDRNISRGEKYVGLRGWEAAWRTWVNNQVEFRNRDARNRAPDMIDGRL